MRCKITYSNRIPQTFQLHKSISSAFSFCNLLLGVRIVTVFIGDYAESCPCHSLGYLLSVGIVCRYLSGLLTHRRGDGCDLRVIDILQPLGCHAMAGRNLRRTNPKVGFKEKAFRNKAFGICHHAAYAAACTRDNQSDVLACHLLAMLEKEGLERSGHLAPPQRSSHDDHVVVCQVDLHRVDGGIGCGIIGTRLRMAEINALPTA